MEAKKKPTYTPAHKRANLKYQKKKRQELKDGLISHLSFGHKTPEAIARSAENHKNKIYKEKAICMIRFLFGKKMNMVK